MLKIGAALIEQGFHKNILLVNTTNWVKRMFDQEQDISPFGDAAAVAVLSEAESSSLLAYKECRIDQHLGLVDMQSPYVTHVISPIVFSTDGAFKQLIRHGLTDLVEEFLVEHKIEKDSIRWLVTHQPAAKVMRNWCHKLGFSPEQHLTTFDYTGNCMAANIPLALEQHVNKKSLIQRGDTILMFAVGTGLSFSVVAWKY